MKSEHIGSLALQKPLKLFVWQGEGILEDYTSGMIVVLATDLDAAYAMLEKTYGTNSSQLECARAYAPEVITHSSAFCCWGGS